VAVAEAYQKRQGNQPFTSGVIGPGPVNGKGPIVRAKKTAKKKELKVHLGRLVLISIWTESATTHGKGKTQKSETNKGYIYKANVECRNRRPP